MNQEHPRYGTERYDGPLQLCHWSCVGLRQEIPRFRSPKRAWTDIIDLGTFARGKLKLGVRSFNAPTLRLTKFELDRSRSKKIRFGTKRMCFSDQSGRIGSPIIITRAGDQEGRRKRGPAAQRQGTDSGRLAVRHRSASSTHTD